MKALHIALAAIIIAGSVAEAQKKDVDTVAEDHSKRVDLALAAAPVVWSPGEAYGNATRRFQGIPGIERAANGRLWATWYAGGDGEGPGDRGNRRRSEGPGGRERAKGG